VKLLKIIKHHLFYTTDLSFEIFAFITNIPKRYSNSIGIEINHMVSPLPSGVMTAPKITIAMSAYLKFFNQNLVPIKPVKDMIYIIRGS
jgi:hypothetical protein